MSTRKADGESNADQLEGAKFLADTLKDYDYQQQKLLEAKQEDEQKETQRIAEANRKRIQTNLISAGIPAMMVYYEDVDIDAGNAMRKLHTDTLPEVFRFCIPDYRHRLPTNRLLYVRLTPIPVWYVRPMQRVATSDDGSGEYEMMAATYIRCKSLGQALKFLSLDEWDQTAEKLRTL